MSPPLLFPVRASPAILERIKESNRTISDRFPLWQKELLESFHVSFHMCLSERRACDSEFSGRWSDELYIEVFSVRPLLTDGISILPMLQGSAVHREWLVKNERYEVKSICSMHTGIWFNG